MVETQSLTDVNRSIVERFYSAGARGDIDTMTDCLADDVVTYEPAYLPFGGQYRGKDALATIFTAVARIADVTQFKIYDILVDGDRAVAFGGYPLNDTGAFTRFAEETRLAGGKITEIRVYYYDVQSMIEAAHAD
ncbi:nuclear transport factor 2 family protein [Mycobacterium syngnathidarum]